jgi:hypothetical protein
MRKYMEPFWFGIIGGLAINLLRLADLAHVPHAERPKTFSDPYYVVQFLVLPLLGGVLVFAYHAGGTAISPILALNIGASAPLIFKSFGSAIPPIGPSKIG